MATGQRTDPFRNFNFLIEIDGIAQGSFSDCTGIGSTTEIIETREGGDNTSVRKLPGKTTFSDITLKWGMTSSRDLWDWRQQIINGQEGARKNGSVVVFDLNNHREVARWNFYNAWPTRWEGPAFSAKGAEVAVETLVLAIEGLERA